MIDGFGIVGSIFHYSLICALTGSAGLLFLYLWKKGRLDMGEESKFQMMEEEDELD